MDINYKYSGVILNFIIPLILMIFIWQVIVSLNLISGITIPSPYDLLLRASEMAGPDPILQNHIYHSLYRFIIGYFIATVVGMAVGVILGINETCYKMFNPFICLFVSLPTIAWVPLLLVLVGLGDATIITAIFLGAFFPMVYNTTAGIQGINCNFIRAAQIMGADKFRIFIGVILPGSLIPIITGLKLGIGNAWRALVGAEMLAATMWGIGYLIYASRAFYDLEAMFLGLFLIGILSLGFDLLIITTLENATIKKWGILRD